MKSKYLSIVGLIFFSIVLTLLAVAHYAYPQGVSYPTGRMVSNDRDNTIIGREAPEYTTTPSPESNPSWVRFLQDNGEIIGIVSILGCVISIINLTERVKKEKEKESGLPR
jgi:hypothetical protein